MGTLHESNFVPAVFPNISFHTDRNSCEFHMVIGQNPRPLGFLD